MNTENIIEYKNYLAELILDTEENVILGAVINTADIIAFHGKSVTKAKKAFRDVLDRYLASCEKDGIEPSRPC
jgi:predicted HicB family RNase H-like nuclease